MKQLLRVLVQIIFLVLFLSCGTTISQFDQYAYTQVTSIKVDALQLVDKGTDEYSAHEGEISAVMTQVDKAYEYEKNRPKNLVTAQMWEEIKNQMADCLVAFLLSGKLRTPRVTS